MKATQRRSIIGFRLALGLAVIGVCLTLVVSWVSCTAGMVRAAAPFLVLAKSASPNPVVAGETLTYVIALTNEGPTALPGVVVSDVAPLQTTLLGTTGPDLWIMSTPNVGDRRSAIWMAPAPLEPGQTVELMFKVQVALSARGSIINDECEARVEGWDEAIKGEPVITRIEAPTLTVIPLPTPRLSSSPGAEREPTDAMVTSTPAPWPRRAGVGCLLALLVLVVIVVIITIVWFIKSGQNEP